MSVKRLLYRTFIEPGSQTFSNSKLIELDKRHEHIHNTANLFTPSIGAGYGLTDNLTVGFRLPYVFRFGIKDVHDADVGKAGNDL